MIYRNAFKIQMVKIIGPNQQESDQWNNKDPYHILDIYVLISTGKFQNEQ